MSAGHRHSYKHSDALVKELKGLLASPDIKAYLAKPYQVKYIKVPLTGGSSIDGKTYYLDPDISEEDRESVLWHERVEKALRVVRQMKYDEAHNLATCAERLKSPDWDAYKERIEKVVHANEKRGKESLPKGFDLGPYRESGMMWEVSGKHAR